MSKLFQKFKKWLSGLTTLVLLVSVLTPSIAFAAVPDVTVANKVTNDNTPMLNGTVDDGTAAVTVTLDGVDYIATNNADGTWTLADNTIAPLADNVYAVTVLATNLDGPSDPAIGSLTVDTVVPTLGEVAPVVTPTNNQTPAYGFTSSEAGDLTYSGSCDSADLVASAGLNNVILSTLSEGIYSDCELTVTDAAGNSSDLTISDFEVDITTPEIVLNGANPMTIERGGDYTDPGATWTDNHDGDGTIYGVGSVNTAVIDTYYVHYNYTDQAGNIAEEVVRTVNVSDTQAPTVDAGENKVVNAPVFQDASASDFPFAITSHLWEQVAGPGTVDFAPDANREDLLISADVDGVYTLRFTATDAGGNSASDTMTLTWDTTAPVIEAGADIRTNISASLNAEATDATSGIASYEWQQVSGPGILSFTDSSSKDTDVTADKDGMYVIGLTVTDNAGNKSYDVLSFEWDTQVSPVKGLKAVAGDKEVELTWVNPADKDLKAIQIYRSLKAGELGIFVIKLTKDAQEYVDLGLVNGTAYFYTVETLDTLDNSAKSVQISATPVAPGVVENPKVLTPIAVAAPIRYYDNNVVSDDSSIESEDQDVKSDEKEKDEVNTETSDSNVPMVGIIILILLIALGLYLLYLQNPEMFGKLAFWKRNKKGGITLGASKAKKNSKTNIDLKTKNKK